MRSAAVILVLASCTFEGASVQPPQDDPDASDPVPDAADDCSGDWSFTPASFDPCLIDDFRGDFDLQDNGEWVLDTNSETLTDPSGAPISIETVSVEQEEGRDVLVWGVNQIRIRQFVVLRAIGPKPLVIAAFDEIEVEGFIDASSRGPGDSQGPLGVGAGSDSGVCATPGIGECNGAESCGGSGGGGFITAGGSGGVANDRAGGAAGGTRALTSEIHGGCSGARGGCFDASDAAIGRGGGAIHLVANQRIRITGTLLANGAGAAGGRTRASGPDRDCGGSGGGSGGYIGIEAPMIDRPLAGISISGGGGAEGGDDEVVGAVGLDGNIAAGGVGGSGASAGAGNGGNGAFSGIAATNGFGSNNVDGAGGGGGGLGAFVEILVVP